MLAIASSPAGPKLLTRMEPRSFPEVANHDLLGGEGLRRGCRREAMGD